VIEINNNTAFFESFRDARAVPVKKQTLCAGGAIEHLGCAASHRTRHASRAHPSRIRDGAHARVPVVVVVVVYRRRRRRAPYAYVTTVHRRRSIDENDDDDARHVAPGDARRVNERDRASAFHRGGARAIERGVERGECESECGGEG